jgi:hypothetical protein
MHPGASQSVDACLVDLNQTIVEINHKFSTKGLAIPNFVALKVFPNSDFSTVEKYASYIDEMLISGYKYVLSSFYYPNSTSLYKIFAVLFHRHAKEVIKYQFFAAKEGVLNVGRSISELNPIIRSLEKGKKYRLDWLSTEEPIVPYARLIHQPVAPDSSSQPLSMILKQIPGLLFPPSAPVPRPTVVPFVLLPPVFPPPVLPPPPVLMVDPRPPSPRFEPPLASATPTRSILVRSRERSAEEKNHVKFKGVPDGK